MKYSNNGGENMRIKRSQADLKNIKTDRFPNNCVTYDSIYTLIHLIIRNEHVHMNLWLKCIFYLI